MSAIPHVQNPTGRLTREHPGLVKLARLGWLAKGIVYLLAGVLVLGLLQRSLGWSDSAGGQEASPTGALNEVADTSWGPALLWALAIGLFLYAAWRVISALLPGSGGAESWARRIGYLCSAALYALLGVTAVALARREQGQPMATRPMATRRSPTPPSGSWRTAPDAGSSASSASS